MRRWKMMGRQLLFPVANGATPFAANSWAAFPLLDSKSGQHFALCWRHFRISSSSPSAGSDGGRVLPLMLWLLSAGFLCPLLLFSAPECADVHAEWRAPSLLHLHLALDPSTNQIGRAHV